MNTFEEKMFHLYKSMSRSLTPSKIIDNINTPQKTKEQHYLLIENSKFYPKVNIYMYVEVCMYVFIHLY